MPSNGATVLHLLTDAYGGHGGISLYNQDVLDSLSGFESVARIVALPRHGERENNLPPKVRWLHQSAGGKWAYLACLFKALLSNRRVDLIVCGHINLLPMAWAAKLICGAPIILFIYGIDAWQRPGFLFVNCFLKRVSKVISISQVTAERFLSWSGLNQEQIALLPNAIDREKFSPGHKNTTLERHYDLEGKRVLMTLARLDARQRHKGIDDILGVLPELIHEIPNLVFLVCGKGDDLLRLQQKAVDGGVAEHVVFTGYVDEAKKADHYRLADAFVLASHGDGFGFVLLEAMACGIPVVASSLDGSKEAVLDGKLGAVVNPKDKAQLLGGLLHAMAQQRGVPDGLEYFSLTRFEKRFSNILDGVMGIYREAQA